MERPVTKIVPMNGPTKGETYCVINYSACLRQGAPDEKWVTRFQAIPEGGAYAPRFDTREQAQAWVDGDFTMVAYLRD